MTVLCSRAAPTIPGRGGEKEAPEAATALPELFKIPEPGLHRWPRHISSLCVRAYPAGSSAAGSRDAPMRPLTMSGHFLLAPIPESSSDYLLPKDIKLAVLGASCVGKSGEWDKGVPSHPGTAEDPRPQGCRDAERPPACCFSSPFLSSGRGWRLLRVFPRPVTVPRGRHFGAAELCPGNLGGMPTVL